VRRLRRQIPLEELKRHSSGALAGMALIKYGRLSVQPVTAAQWEFVLGLEDEQAEPPS
jgi:predicted RNA-binding protein with PUA-like domain